LAGDSTIGRYGKGALLVAGYTYYEVFDIAQLSEGFQMRGSIIFASTTAIAC
jgi:hypothetical protein